MSPRALEWQACQEKQRCGHALLRTSGADGLHLDTGSLVSSAERRTRLGQHFAGRRISEFDVGLSKSCSVA